MLKKFVLALMPLTLLATSVNADDLNIDVASITDADVEIVENDLNIDVDALSAEAGEDSSEDAIEACFRRFGYGGRWGGGYHNSRYGGYFNSCYNGYYNNCHSYCRPLYSYRTITCCRPVYRCVVTPIYHYYWGCH